MVKKEYVSWEQVEDFVREVAEEYKDKGITGIFGLPRGGLCMAVMLSNKMNLPMLLAPANNCLIVDDIADSGRSLIHYTENDTQFNKYDIVTLFYDERSIVKPNLYRYKKNGRWIVFPWEMEEVEQE